MLWNSRQDFQCIILLRGQVDHGLLLGLKVITPVHILAKLVGTFHVIELAVTAWIGKNIEGVGIVRLGHLNIEGWYSRLLTWRLVYRHSHWMRL